MRNFFSPKGGRSAKAAVVFADQAVSSLNNVLVLIFAARILSPADLSIYATFQLLVMTVVALQRAALLTPALAAQRSSGRSAVSMRWTLIAAPSGAMIASALVASFVVVDHRHNPAVLALVSFMVAAVVLVQDLTRFRLLMLGRAWVALSSDSLWLILSLAALGVLWALHASSLVYVAVAWGAGAFVALAVALFFARSVGMSASKFSATWRLGRWSLLEAALAQSMIVLPLFVSGLTASPDQVGVYRVLQSATGPLNLINSSVTLTFGLGAWALSGTDALDRLSRKVKKVYSLLVPTGVIVVCGVQPLVLLLANIPLDRDVLWPMVAVGAAAMMGVVISPLQAAAQALGYQRFGPIVRGAVVVVGLGVSAVAIAGVAPFVADPVGWSLLATNLVSMTGWLLGYRRAMALESR